MKAGNIKNIFIYLVLIMASCICVAQTQNDLVKGNLIQFNNNGAWCWYQDERAIIDSVNHKLIVASVSTTSQQNAVIYDIQTGISKKFTLASLESDDHSAPALIIRPNDGRYLTMYAKHYDGSGSSYPSRYRIYNPAAETWDAEQIFNWYPTNYTICYSNMYYLSAEDRMYNFVRGNNRAPNFMYSDNFGDSWSYGGQIKTNSSSSYNKGYFKYWSNGIDRIDFICTEQHPRDTYTSMYHGYIQNGKSYNTFGVVADDDIYNNSFIPTDNNFYKFFADNTSLGGYTMRRIWNADLMRYNDGIIAAILTARTDSYTGGDASINPQHAFIYSRFNGTSWTSTYLCRAGQKLYSSEADYTGLAALHPNDPNTVYVSTTYDPRNNTSLTVHEIFKGVTTNNGATWTWTPITQNSSRDNLRPIVPPWNNENTALLWFRGTYTSAQNVDAAVVGIIERAQDSVVQKIYVDATTSNTTLANGSALVTTGPNGNDGPTDNQWHRRTGSGNGSTVYTSADLATENAPVIRTGFTAPSTESYDIWVNFWAIPNSDWRIEAGLSSSNMQIFRSRASQQVQAGEHTTTLILSASNNSYLYQAYLGRVEANTGNTIYVYVDDEASGITTRTWYDGISYSVVVEKPLPVELSMFTAVIKNNSVELLWNTETETNNLGFEVERMVGSSKNNSWEKIAFVYGNGNSNSPKSYSYTDENVSGNNISYRLKQLDFDGTFAYSHVAEVKVFPCSFELSQNYPNPFNPTTKIKYSLPAETQVSIKLFDILGNEIKTLVSSKQIAGNYEVVLDAGNLSSGTYFYKMQAGEFTQSRKLILLK